MALDTAQIPVCGVRISILQWKTPNSTMDFSNIYKGLGKVEEPHMWAGTETAHLSTQPCFHTPNGVGTGSSHLKARFSVPALG